MIRNATEADLPKLLEMGQQFFAASEYADITTFSRKTLEATMRNLITGEHTCLLVPDDLSGMVAGITYPFYFSKDKTAQELFWWASKPGQGKALLESFEAWAKEQGAKSVTMICLDRLGKERVEKIYDRAGYRPSEHSFIKRV